jgi:uncharacterized RDD family membrane protein YckC
VFFSLRSVADSRGVAMVAGRLERYPFPLAYPAHAITTARTAEDRLGKAQHFIELTAVTLGILTLAWCRDHDAVPEAVQKWEDAAERKGLALGGWITLLQSARPALTDDQVDPLGRSIGLAVDGAWERLNTFTPTRNQFAHGGRPQVRGEVENAATDLEHRASTILDSIESLSSVRVAAVRNWVPVPNGQLEIDLDVFTGYAEIPSPQRLRSQRSFPTGTVLAYKTGQLESATDLTPYCIYHKCLTCGRDELFYLTKRNKNRSDHFTFATGHKLQLKGDQRPQAPVALASVGLEPLSSRRTEAAQGWRTSWVGLAPRSTRLLARFIDLAVAVGIGAVIGILASITGIGTAQALLVALAAGLTYEPVAALHGGTLGKRTLGIQPISVWDGRPLSTADTLRRAFAVDGQIVLPVLAVRSLACLLWDPSRQGLHDRAARSIVVSGRSSQGHKL